MKMKSCGSTFVNKLLHYETQKIVDIKNKKVGALFRFIQSMILAYIIGYVIIHKKGYQESDVAVSTVSTKLKGTAAVNFTHLSKLYNGVQVFDPADYVIPPQETDGFFVMTNMVVTPLQAQGIVCCVLNLLFSSFSTVRVFGILDVVFSIMIINLNDCK